MSTTPARLELVPERTSNLELYTEALSRTQEELLWDCKIYESIPSVYFILDAAGTILFVNQFGANYLGYVPDELLQKPIFQLFASLEQQRLANVLTGLLGATPSGKVASWEFRYNCPMRKIEWVKVVVRLLPSEGKQIPRIIMVCEDITAYKHHENFVSSFIAEHEQSHSIADAEVALTESQNTVQAHLAEMIGLNRLQEEFLATVSHELRTPLTNMKMAIQMLGIALNQEHNFFAEMAKPQTECSKAARYFKILVNECDREINLINNFLDLQRLDTSNKPVVLETIQVQEWLEQVMKLFNTRDHLRHHCQHQMLLHVEPNLPPLVCDSFSLERILIELLTNACKFSPRGATITMTAQLSGNFQFQVINSGVEIPATELPRIFDRFYRIPSNDPWKQGGMGLGLALVQKLIKHLGATIKVESQVNHTCFTIELPLLHDR